jgi:hypothetical protein
MVFSHHSSLHQCYAAEMCSRCESVKYSFTSDPTHCWTLSKEVNSLSYVGTVSGRGSPVSVVTKLCTLRQGFDFRQGQGIFFFAAASRPTDTHSDSYEMDTRDSFPRVKRPGREADYASPSVVESNTWSFASTPPNFFMAWYLVKHRDSITFTFGGSLHILT